MSIKGVNATGQTVNATVISTNAPQVADSQGNIVGNVVGGKLKILAMWFAPNIKFWPFPKYIFYDNISAPIVQWLSLCEDFGFRYFRKGEAAYARLLIYCLWLFWLLFHAYLHDCCTTSVIRLCLFLGLNLQNCFFLAFEAFRSSWFFRNASFSHIFATFPPWVSARNKEALSSKAINHQKNW